MKQSYFLLGGALALAATVAAASGQMKLPENFDLWNLNFKFPLEQMETPATKIQAKAPVRQGLRPLNAPAKEAAEATEYFVVGQTFHKDYVFTYDGGAFTTYNIGIARDGDKVTISNLFNLEAQSTEWSVGVDYDVVGTYDEATKTITIPASSNFDNATICGTIGDYYTEVLLAGTVNEDGQMAPAENLVLNVEGDFEAISTEMNFAIANFTNDGSTNYGMQTCYRSFYAVIPQAEPKLVAFNNSYDLGTSFPLTDAECTWTVVNVSSVAVDYAIAVEADDNSFTAAPDAGSIDPQSLQEITFKFNAPAPGDYEGIATLTYDGNESTPAPLEVLLMANAVPYPDYSPIVKAGDFDFTTNIEFPFTITQLEDGTTVARSSNDGNYGKSQLSAHINVPEGKLAKVSWKGECVNNGYWYYNAANIYVDDMYYPWQSYTASTPIDNSCEFGTGEHFVTFEYDCMRYTGDAQNCLYVYDLELTLEDAPESSAVVVLPEVNVGNFMLDGVNPVEGYAVVTIQNRGSNPLSVSAVSSDNSAFVPTKPEETAELLGTLDIPVMFSTTEAGQHTATLTIETSAGTLTASLKALVRKMADFTSLVTEGSELVTSITTSNEYPFEVENGVAYNANSGEADDEATTSWFQINFTVPEGKAVYMDWDGHLYGDLPDSEVYWDGDQGAVDIMHPMNSGTYPFYPDMEDISSQASIGQDEFWKSFLTCIPGEHYIQFKYTKNGDGRISEKDRMEISNIRLRVEDFPEHGVKAETEEVEFPEIYVGQNRKATTALNLLNTGSAQLEVTGEESNAPFYCVIPEGYSATAQFNGTVQVGIWFFPTEEGEYEGDVTFKTNAGDVKVHCKASTKSSDGIVLIGDVEDEAIGWSFYDADKDGECWNLGYNLWGENPAWVHEGLDCFGSASQSIYGNAIEPDNWLFSPAISVPADGAMARWYTAAHHHERYAEKYSVYVATPEQVEDVENLNSLTPLFTTTLPEESADIWQENTLDLAEYAGKDVHLVFRHYDCFGQYVLKLDDIFVYTMDKWADISSVDEIAGNSDVVSTEIFDLNGLRKRQLSEGVNIVRIVYSDGTVKTSKLIVK